MTEMDRAIVDIEEAMANLAVEANNDHELLSKSVEARPIHRLEGIRSMQQSTLDQAIAHRKAFEVQKDTDIADAEQIYKALIDNCDAKVTKLTEALAELQREKKTLMQSLVDRRQEILDKFKADDDALMKIIKAQRMVISALGESDGSISNTGEAGNADKINDRQQA
jgi:hypothetical protein